MKFNFKNLALVVLSTGLLFLASCEEEANVLPIESEVSDVSFDSQGDNYTVPDRPSDDNREVISFENTTYSYKGELLTEKEFMDKYPVVATTAHISYIGEEDVMHVFDTEREIENFTKRVKQKYDVESKNRDPRDWVIQARFYEHTNHRGRKFDFWRWAGPFKKSLFFNMPGWTNNNISSIRLYTNNWSISTGISPIWFTCWDGFNMTGRNVTAWYTQLFHHPPVGPGYRDFPNLYKGNWNDKISSCEFFVN